MVFLIAQAAALFANGPLLAALGACAVAVPILIHLFSRMRRTPEPWGAMRFLMQAYRKRRKRLRLEQLLLLLVRCAILLVLGLALAGPLLGGCAGRLTSGLDAGAGRTLVVVLDDSLSTQATQARGRTRFDALRGQALEAIAALRPGDRVSVVRAGRPVEAVIPVPTGDLAEARRVVEGMRPRASRSELGRALAEVAASMRERPEAYGGSTAVLVLSDFARGADYLEDAMPEGAAELGKLARVVVSRPDAGAGNVQVRSVRPRRRVVLASGGDGPGGGVPVEATVRRFDGAASAAEATLRLELLSGSEGEEVVSSVERPVTFGPGQSEANVNAELPLPPRRDVGRGGRVLVVRAVLDPRAGAMADAISLDDEAWSVVEVREALRVAIVGGGDAAGGGLATGGDPEPADWLELALMPMEASPMRAARVEPRRLSEAGYWRGEAGGEAGERPDAVFVLSPDEVTGEGWTNLGAFVRKGGVVWVMPPVGAVGGEGEVEAWSQRMRAALGLDWVLGGGPDASSGTPQRRRGEDGGEMELGLDASGRVPEALGILSADWESLLRPVRVRRMVGVAMEGDAEVWLRVAGAGEAEGRAGAEPDASSQTPQRRREDQEEGAVMVVEGVGSGAVVWLGVALDGEWSNLPTKPLLVPLVHETLRALVGRGRRGEEVTAGDEAVLGEGVSAVRRLGGVGGGDTATEVAAPGVAAPGAGVMNEPGVYAPVTGDVGGRIAVNVDADAGDAREGNGVETWLNGLGDGRWSFLDATDTAAALETASQRTNLGWPLLWVVLALVLGETLLARLMSHTPTNEGGAATLLRRVRSVGVR